MSNDVELVFRNVKVAIIVYMISSKSKQEEIGIEKYKKYSNYHNNKHYLIKNNENKILTHTI